jgi:hypothetical protein
MNWALRAVHYGYKIEIERNIINRTLKLLREQQSPSWQEDQVQH